MWVLGPLGQDEGTRSAPEGLEQLPCGSQRSEFEDGSLVRLGLTATGNATASLSLHRSRMKACASALQGRPSEFTPAEQQSTAKRANPWRASSTANEAQVQRKMRGWAISNGTALEACRVFDP